MSNEIAVVSSTNNELNALLNNGREDRITWIGGRAYYTCNPVVKCKDGYEVSVQCQETSYCQPRLNLPDVADYESFELGYPSSIDTMLNGYAEELDTTKTVFPYVPRSVVIRLIEAHGGLKEY